MLSGLRRVRISGCAGSGETLVAAEKALRLARAGVTTLFLCHNPLLAEHVRENYVLLLGGAHSLESTSLIGAKLSLPAEQLWLTKALLHYFPTCAAR